VARVETKPIRLSEIQELKRRNIGRYQKETGRTPPPAYDTFFLRLGLEEAVRQRLVELDARARGLTVTDAQAESAMKLDPLFRPQGKFDPARWESYRTANPKSFADAREQARSGLLYQRRMRALERELLPAPTEIDAISRTRDLKARVRYVLVSDLHYDGRNDPTDEELRTYYQQHKDELARPSELAYTAATVLQPEDEAGRAAARARSAELLAAARNGAPFDSLLRLPGVESSSGVWRPGTAAGLFAKDGATAEAALAQPVGTVLPQLIDAPRGPTLVRVDRSRTKVQPSLSEIAVDLRARWRSQKIEAEDRAALQRYYESHADSFATPAWYVRWARIDSSKVASRTPKETDLRAWYDAHRGEFARLDPAGGGIQTRPFEEVREQVTAHWRVEDRALEARRLADELATAWVKGKNGPGSKAITTGGPAWIVNSGAVPEDLPRALADSAISWPAAPRALVAAQPDGFEVVGLQRYEPRFRAPFASVEPRVRDLMFTDRLAAERAAARDWFDAHPELFRTGPGYEIAYAISPPPPSTRVDLPGARIERYYKEHPSEFGTPPEVHVRHILIMNDRRDDADAFALASRLLSRVRRGENFAALAREFSEDTGSRDHGGDLGFVRRGTTVPPFERAAFALTTDQPISGAVKSQFGYHIIQLVERREGRVPPFSEVRADLAQKLAIEYADTLARVAAEDLRQKAKTRDQLLTMAGERQFPNLLARWYEGEPLVGPAVLDGLRADVVNLRPGEIFPRIYRYQQQGYVIAALDGVFPPRQLTFDEAKDRALQEKRTEGSRAAALARADRLSRDLASGVPWERAIETIGGETVTSPIGRDVGLPSLGPVAGLDSLLFGPGADTLATGAWKRITTPRGELFVQLIERSSQQSAQNTAERETLRSTILNRRMYDYVERLRSRYPVTVLRRDLAERIPPPPAL
jgi:parvulin-like peptidyl-prolyl isomerase